MVEKNKWLVFVSWCCFVVSGCDVWVGVECCMLLFYCYVGEVICFVVNFVNVCNVFCVECR